MAPFGNAVNSKNRIQKTAIAAKACSHGRKLVVSELKKMSRETAKEANENFFFI
jgi:hypothetical protein